MKVPLPVPALTCYLPLCLGMVVFGCLLMLGRRIPRWAKEEHDV